jgi:hypothetical protein
MYNEIQQKILHGYEGGEFAYLCEPAATEADLENCGDGLLVFVIREVADSEGCDSVEMAYDRIERGIKNFEEILGILAAVEKSD